VSSIGKITIMVEQTATAQVIAVRTTGKKGSVLLNTISNNAGYASHSPSPDAHTFWTDVLTKALTQV
jgi:hypothetical protein